MAILKIRDDNGKIIEIPSFRGEPGKSAYEIAVDNGYEGTEAEWSENQFSNVKYIGEMHDFNELITNMTSSDLVYFFTAETTATELPAKIGKGFCTARYKTIDLVENVRITNLDTLKSYNYEISSNSLTNIADIETSFVDIGTLPDQESVEAFKFQKNILYLVRLGAGIINASGFSSYGSYIVTYDEAGSSSSPVKYLTCYSLSNRRTYSYTFGNVSNTSSSLQNIYIADEQGYYNADNVDDAFAEIGKKGAKITLTPKQIEALTNMFKIVAYTDTSAKTAYEEYLYAFGQYVTIKELLNEDLKTCGLSYLYSWSETALNTTGPYTRTANNRTSYANFDIPVEYGYTYKFEFEYGEIPEGEAAPQIGIEVYNQNALAAKEAQTDMNSADLAQINYYASGWEYTPTETINDSPVAAMRITFNTGTVVINKVVITRKCND